MASDGSIIIDTRIDTSGFQTGTRQLGSNFSKLGSSIKKLGVTIGAVFAVKKVIDFGKEAISLGSDLQEVQNVVDSVFTTMSKQVDEFARNAAASAGLSETMAKRYTGTFGAMAKSFGFAEDEAFNMSTSLTQLSGDLASFYNISQDEAYTKLKSVFTGETESLKELGVVMTQSALDAYAMANGFGKTTSAMTEQEKVALRYQFVMNQLSTASGDFVRTSDSWANQVRVLQLQIESLKATIGAGLINIFTPVIKVINVLLSKLATVANAFKAFTELITGKKSTGGSTSANSTGIEGMSDAYSSATQSADDYSKATNNVAKSTKKANKEQSDYLSGLDEIRKYTSNAAAEITTPSTVGIGGIDSGVISGGMVGLEVDYGSLAEGETVVDELALKFETLFNKIKTAVEPLAAEISRFGSIASSAFGWFFDNVLVPLSNWTMNEVVPRYFQTLANIMRIVNNVLVVLQPAWQWFWENVLLPIATWTGGIFLQIWDTINHYLERFGDWILEHEGLVQNLWKNWDTIKEKAAQLKDWLIEKTRKMYEDVTQFFARMREKISYYVGILGEWLSETWDGIKAKAIEIWENITTTVSEKAKALKENVTEKVRMLKDKVVGFWNTIKSNAVDKWESIKSKVLEFADSIKEGVSSAFEGMKNTIKDIFESLVDIMKVPINAVVGLLNGLIFIINKFINKLNDIFTFEIGFELPKWMGGGEYKYRHTMNIPNVNPIPYLATGAVIPPNAPFMAVLGDQRNGTNLEAPESLIRQIVREEAGGNKGGTYYFIGQLNGRTLFEEMIEEGKEYLQQTGRNPFELVRW